MSIYIKKGYAFKTGPAMQAFARMANDVELTVESKAGRYLYGEIDGNPNSILGFMRYPRIRVCVALSCTIER